MSNKGKNALLNVKVVEMGTLLTQNPISFCRSTSANAFKLSLKKQE